uniref:Si:ch211-283g2.3 n=1 Tax=Cyprinus carpio carpio TaxID=630221 RepID=A0A8C1DNW2_CYPCA
MYCSLFFHVVSCNTILHSLFLSLIDLLTSGCNEPDWIPFRNSCYLFSQDVMNWTKARDYCEEKGALLLKIEDGSEKEWQFVINFAKPHDYWVGLTDQNTGQWRWTDDTPYIMNREAGQPDEWTEHGLGEGGEDCGQIAYDGLLNDAHCSAKMNFRVCELCKLQFTRDSNSQPKLSNH